MHTKESHPIGAPASPLLAGDCELATELEAAAGFDGVRVEDLGDVDEVRVRTRNTVYHFHPAAGSPLRFVVEGGAQFPAPTEVVVAGAAVEGSVKAGWIGFGHPLVLVQGSRCVVTSRVEGVEID
jgi:hypothetical protein